MEEDSLSQSQAFSPFFLLFLSQTHTHTHNLICTHTHTISYAHMLIYSYHLCPDILEYTYIHAYILYTHILEKNLNYSNNNLGNIKIMNSTFLPITTVLISFGIRWTLNHLNLWWDPVWAFNETTLKKDTEIPWLRPCLQKGPWHLIVTWERQWSPQSKAGVQISCRQR